MCYLCVRHLLRTKRRRYNTQCDLTDKQTNTPAMIVTNWTRLCSRWVAITKGWRWLARPESTERWPVATPVSLSQSTRPSCRLRPSIPSFKVIHQKVIYVTIFQMRRNKGFWCRSRMGSGTVLCCCVCVQQVSSSSFLVPPLPNQCSVHTTSTHFLNAV